MSRVFGQRLQLTAQNCVAMSFRRRGNSWRGARGGSYGGRYYEQAEDSGPQSSSSSDSRRGGGWGRGRGGHGGYNRQDGSGPKSGRPPHLRGKAIGMYYRDLGAKERTERKEKVEAAIRKGFSVTLTPERQQHLTKLISQLNSSSYESTKSSCSFQQKYMNNVQRNLATTSSGPSSSQTNTETKAEWGLHRLFSATYNPDVDEQLKVDLQRKQGSPSYQKMLEFRKKLPTYDLRNEIIKLIEQNQVTILSGETGCGKTTQVPQFILDSEIRAGRGSLCNIICTQPRRISAITVAERVASERDEDIGNSVGYSIRLQHRHASKSAGIITFMTTGVIFQCLKFNKNLDNVSHLIIDEIHERSIHSDFLLTILKDLVVHRPNLKVVLMSATLSAMDFKNYFGRAVVFHIPGFTFPITEYYLEDAIQHTRFVFENNDDGGPLRGWRKHAKYEHEDFIGPYTTELRNSKRYSPSVIQQLENPASEEISVDFIHSLVEYICATDEKFGAILIFATGWDMISKIISSFENSGRFPPSKFKIFPLHSMMPTVNQKEIFQRPQQGVRKIVVATQIAETSITIDDILFVIDTGKIKLGNFDEVKNMATLDTEWVSLANATQRRGRAGRVQAGFVYHLFSRARRNTLEEYKKPEVLRTRLEEVVLQIKILELGNAAELLKRLMNPPSDRSIYLALERLRELHAIDVNENLTPLGYHLAQLPMDPQTAKMILMGAIFSCADPIFSIAACLSFKDPFYIPLGKERQVDEIRRRFSASSKSDHVLVARVIEDYERAVECGNERNFCYRNFLSQSTLKMLINMKQQFAEYLEQLGFLSTKNYKAKALNLNSDNWGMIIALTGAGLYPNVVRVNVVGRSGRIVLKEGRQLVKFHPGCVNFNEKEFESPYLVYYKKMKSTAVFLHDTSMVSPFSLIFFGGRLDWIPSEFPGKYEDNTGVTTSQFDSVAVDGDKLVFSYPSQQNFRFIVESLRTELDLFLEHKVNNPGQTEWDSGSKEGALLNAITEILTSEYEHFQSNDNDDDYPPEDN